MFNLFLGRKNSLLGKRMFPKEPYEVVIAVSPHLEKIAKEMFKPIALTTIKQFEELGIPQKIEKDELNKLYD